MFADGQREKCVEWLRASLADAAKPSTLVVEAAQRAGYTKFEQGKIFVAVQGGGYNDDNVIPENPKFNRDRGNKPVRKENLT